MVEMWTWRCLLAGKASLIKAVVVMISVYFDVRLLEIFPQ